MASVSSPQPAPRGPCASSKDGRSMKILSISPTNVFETPSLSSTDHFEGTEVRNQATTALYLVLMAAVITAVDLLFFKHRFWERLTANVGIVLIFAAFY